MSIFEDGIRTGFLQTPSDGGVLLRFDLCSL